MASCKLMLGNCLERMKEIESESVDAIRTDPPYGISFMGEDFDNPKHMVGQATGISGGFQRIPKGVDRPDMSKNDPHIFQAWSEAWGREALRILRPGGHCLSFASTRTYHRMTAGLEDAGFEIRDMITWNYLQGMPKTKHTLKPGIEPICVARKPCEGTQRDNILRHGVGGLFMDRCRIPGHDKTREAMNVMLDDGCSMWIDELVGERTSGARKAGKYSAASGHVYGEYGGHYQAEIRGGAGGPSRMMFVAKPSPAERNAGLEGKKNPHKTVKPIKLMRELIKLACPPGGRIVDPFLGSGTTGCAAMLENIDFVGIEMEPEYMALAEARIRHWKSEAQS